MFGRSSKPTCCYCGSRQWAEAHAAQLAHLVGRTADGMTVSAVCARPYGSSKRKWGVVTRWRYASNPGLGEFGDAFIALPTA